MKVYKLRKFFDLLIYSCDVKARKPDSKIYKIALKKLKVRPEEAVFIDDKHENVNSAKKLGIHGIIFKNNKQTINELEKILKK